jgi:hypothetical protein
MALRPEMSVMVGLATATVVFAVHSKALPSTADVRSLPAHQNDLDAAERTASWISAATVAGISLITGDMTVFIIGGSMVIAMAWWNRHSNMVIPELGKAVPQLPGETDMVSDQGMAADEDYNYTASE